MTGFELRNGIFALRTRRLGKVAELLVKRMNALQSAKSQFHDLYDDIAQQRVEVKFSTVLRKHKMTLNEDNVLDAIRNELMSKRAIQFAERNEHKFDCNIQQIKRAEFDVLYYGLFFYDKIIMFRILPSEIGSEIGYSDKQHKGNVGEGQFHITESNIAYHLEHYKYAELTYDDLLTLLQPN